MDGVILLQQAETAGLVVDAQGDRLVIRGARSAQSIAQMLIAHKTSVLDAIARRSQSASQLPTSTQEHSEHVVHASELLHATCDLCGSSGPVLVKRVGSRGTFWMCGACHIKLGGG